MPGSNPSLFEKAAKGAADIIFLDLEDAVAPDDKEQARKNIVQGLNDLDWGTKTMMIRINGLDTHYAYRDVVDVVENCPRLDMILIPKTGVPQDVYAIDMLVTQIEQYKKREKKIGFELLIETALGMANVERDRASLQARRSHELRRRRLCRLHPRAHHGHRRAASGLRHPLRQGRRQAARLLLERPLALRAVAHDGRLPRLRSAADRRAVRRLLRSRRLSRRGEARRRARLRGQMGDPSLAGGARQPGVHAVGSGGRPRPSASSRP